MEHVSCHICDDVAYIILKIYKCIIEKNKTRIMYYNILLERGEKTEAIDIILLHFKIARGMIKLLIFNCFCLRDMSRNMDSV